MKIKLKLLLLSMMFIGLGLSFCSADGIYWNKTGGLISIVYNDGTNVITLSDKNLGATSTDVSSSNSYGLYFQRGNNFGFNAFSSNFSYNSSTYDIPTTFGPGNYFNSNGVFYYTLNNQGNYNLWGAVDGTFEAMQGPCPSGYHIIDNWANIQSIFTTYFGLSSTSSIGFYSYLKMPLAGYITRGDSCIGNGCNGHYWASSTSNNFNGDTVQYDSVSATFDNIAGFYGLSIRCFKNESVNPDYTRDKIYGDVIEKQVTIDVFYNNDESYSTVVCNGDNSIHINGLATKISSNVFTPYFNIDYIDENNQKLTESYSKDILYLSGGLFKKTYTGDNYRVLTDTIELPNPSFSGYLPTFEITGGIEEVSESGNIFNNFAENSVKFTLSNIPSYIQYVILLFILFFILGFIRKFRRK